MTNDLAAFMADLNLDLDSEDISNIEPEDKKIFTFVEYPHILIDRDELLKVLKVIMPIVNLKSNRNIPKALTFYWEDDVLKYLITDDLSYFTKRVNILNTDNILKETLCIPLNILQSALKAFGNQILIYKKDNNYYIRLVTGDLILDLVRPEESLLKRPGQRGNELMYTGTSSLGDALKAVLPIVACEVIPEKRKLTFINNKIEFNTSKFLITYDIKVPDMKISYRTAEFLRGLCSLYDGTIFFYKDINTLNRIHIECEGVEYTTSIGVDNMNAEISAFIDKRKELSGIWVDYKLLDSIITLASGLNYAIGSVIFKYDEENNLVLELPNTRGVSSFKINAESTMLSENKSTVTVLSKSLKKLLGSFNSDSIYVVLNNDSITMYANCVTGVLLK